MGPLTEEDRCVEMRWKQWQHLSPRRPILNLMGVLPWSKHTLVILLSQHLQYNHGVLGHFRYRWAFQPRQNCGVHLSRKNDEMIWNEVGARPTIVAHVCSIHDEGVGKLPCHHLVLVGFLKDLSGFSPGHHKRGGVHLWRKKNPKLRGEERRPLSPTPVLYLMRVWEQFHNTLVLS